MYAILGVTGRVGGAAADRLLRSGNEVRAVLRNSAAAAHWEARGAQVVLADSTDAEHLTRAFDDVQAAFVMVPPCFAPAPGFPEARAVIAAITTAAAAARVPHLVALSSIGAQHATGLGLITQSHLFEQALSTLPGALTLLRPAWFMENCAWDIAPAKAQGVLHAFLSPLDRPYPMVSTRDIGLMAADFLRAAAAGRRVIEIEGPRRYTQVDLAEALGSVLKRSVGVQPVPRAGWDRLFRSQGSEQPAARMEMLDGFNNGWIDFEFQAQDRHRGSVALRSVLESLNVAR